MEGWKGKNEENGLVSLENTENLYIYIRRCSYEAERFSLEFIFRGTTGRKISEFFLDRKIVVIENPSLIYFYYYLRIDGFLLEVFSVKKKGKEKRKEIEDLTKLSFHDSRKGMEWKDD